MTEKVCLRVCEGVCACSWRCGDSIQVLHQALEVGHLLGQLIGLVAAVYIFQHLAGLWHIRSVGHSDYHRRSCPSTLSQQGSAGQGRRLIGWMAGGWDRRYCEALEWVGVGVWVGRAVGGQVAGVAGLLLCGGGAVVAALRVGHDLRGARGLGGSGGYREGL